MIGVFETANAGCEKNNIRKVGFLKIDRSKLPLKIWGDCIICVKFPDCDETAMMKEMDL